MPAKISATAAQPALSTFLNRASAKINHVLPQSTCLKGNGYLIPASIGAVASAVFVFSLLYCVQRSIQDRTDPNKAELKVTAYRWLITGMWGAFTVAYIACAATRYKSARWGDIVAIAATVLTPAAAAGTCALHLILAEKRNKAALVGQAQQGILFNFNFAANI